MSAVGEGAVIEWGEWFNFQGMALPPRNLSGRIFMHTPTGHMRNRSGVRTTFDQLRFAIPEGATVIPAGLNEFTHYIGRFWLLTRYEGAPLSDEPDPADARDAITCTLQESLPGAGEDAWCPELYECPGVRSPIWNLIIHLNDDHKWSRSQIADWLETLDTDLTFDKEGARP